MSSTKIPPRTVVALWTKSGGRCEYRGCNELLWQDKISMREVNGGLVAHVVADSPDGPRGDAIRSPQIAKALENLMLMCHPHHHLIDHEGLADHPEHVLLEMKREHEMRIAHATSIGPELATHVVVFRTPIGDERLSNDTGAMRRAVIAAGRYPLRDEISLDLTLVPATERRVDFWESSRRELDDFYAQQMQWRLAKSEPHLSVFALAPIPLLMAFGKLLGDKTPALVFQRFRDPPGWTWPTEAPALTFDVSAERAPGRATDVILLLSVSDTVQRPDVIHALPSGAPVYELRIAEPRRDCVRNAEDVAAFRAAWQLLLNRVRDWYQEDAPRLHIVPALPNSLAVELGRSVLQKAHSRLSIYDLNHNLGGLQYAFDL